MRCTCTGVTRGNYRIALKVRTREASLNPSHMCRARVCLTWRAGFFTSRAHNRPEIPVKTPGRARSLPTLSGTQYGRKLCARCVELSRISFSVRFAQQPLMINIRVVRWMLRVSTRRRLFLRAQPSPARYTRTYITVNWQLVYVSIV